MQRNAEILPKVSVFIVTDGRLDCLKQTLFSFSENVKFDFIQKFIVNDSLDFIFSKELTVLAGIYGFSVINHEVKKGFSGAYNTAFANVSKDSEYCFILEDDFTFNEVITISGMIKILQDNPYLCQVALKRQAWGVDEEKAGGLVEMWPDMYEDKEGFCQHRQFFTTNPSLVPAWVIAMGWPLVPKSEKIFGDMLFEESMIYSAYLGAKFDPPKVHHIGVTRNGINY